MKKLVILTLVIVLCNIFVGVSAETPIVVAQISYGTTSAVKTGALHWFDTVNSLFKRGDEATILDTKTGETFRIKRTYGTNHADIEPLTKEDAEIIKKIWGGYSWDRRSVIVFTDNAMIAASMAAMPHAGVDSKAEGVYVSGRSQGYGYGVNLDAVKGNGVDGHMDLHFLGSRTHGTNKVDKKHQQKVKEAEEYLLANY